MIVPTIRVTVPYGVAGGAAAGSLQVDAVAGDLASAQAIAAALAATWLRLRHAGSGFQPRAGRAKIGARSEAVEGFYAYVLSRRDHIHRLAFPRRIDGVGGEALAQSLDGLDAAQTFAVVFDLGGLDYINTTGLGALLGNSKRLRLLLSGAGDTIRHVFDAVGLTRLLPLHQDVAAALASLS
jgi:anti-anti-sigma factor